MPNRMADKLSEIRRKIYRRLPGWMKSHDFEVFVSSLGLLSGVPIIFGGVKPQSVDALLPHQVVFLWGLTLVLGCGTVLLGIFQGSRRIYPDKIFWMRIEALGLTALAYFCYIYTVCILGFNFSGGWSAAMIILGFGLTCHVREAAILIEAEEYRVTVGLKGRR